MDAPNTQFFVDLESRVWDALAAGDAIADRALLSADFVGVYPTGFADRDDHSGQLSDGPTVSSYTISDARVLRISDDAVLLSYRAEYGVPGRDERSVMFISSIWRRHGAEWLNIFSQDSLADD